MPERVIRTLLLIAVAFPSLLRAAGPPATLDSASAARFAALALKCLHQEYPNKISHTMKGDADARAPRELTPAFLLLRTRSGLDLTVEHMT